MENREILTKIVIANEGNWRKTLSDLQNKVFDENSENYKGECITLFDNEYPSKLKGIYCPPFVLFYKGNIDLLSHKDIIGLAIDDKPVYSMETLKKFVIDTNHHYIIGENKMSKAIAKETKNLIVVLKQGLDLVDKELADLVLNNNGLLITECPDGTQTQNDYTRIISGIENRLVVIQIKKQSSTWVQVNHSINNNNKVYVMPMPLDSKIKTENNTLIYDGAYPFISKEQLDED